MPVIGLSTYLEQAKWGAWDLPAALVPAWYLELLQDAGADVVLLPPGTGPEALDRLDGLVLAGGADVDARRYGAAPHPTADVPRESRDATELALYLHARERQMPVLGICRGMQVMAVAHGGTLHQDLPEVPGTIVHRERPGHFVAHDANLLPGSTIARIYGASELTVNSSHHQAVADAGSLLVTGTAQDGTIEVCEDPSVDFCLGVQWHPEHPDRREQDLRLAQAFVRAAADYRVLRPV